MKFFVNFTPLLLLIGILAGCSASGTSDRYNDNSTPKEAIPNEELITLDISKDLTIPSYYNPKNNSDKNEILWESFDDDSISSKKFIRVPGYRIQVLTTDDFDEADSLKLILYQQLKPHSLYIIFEPPYYKLRVGDFSDISLAYDLQFRMRQIGYRNTSITNDTVTVRSK